MTMDLQQRRLLVICLILCTTLPLGNAQDTYNMGRLRQRQRRLPQEEEDRRRLSDHGLFTEERTIENAQEVKNWRQRFREECQAITTTESVKGLLRSTQEAFKASRIGDQFTHEHRLDPERCKYVFMYASYNKAEEPLKHFIESGLPRCASADIENPMWDLAESRVKPERGHRNDVRSWLTNRMGEFNQNLGPEEYCVYGIEPSSSYTEGLERLERRIMRTTPRPVRRVHFFLDTALVQIDDKVLLSSQGSVNESPADLVNNRGYNYGRSLTSLIFGLVQEGGHLMIQLDMGDSSEFAVLNEAAESGVFCRYVQEFHATIDLYVLVQNEESNENSSRERYQSEMRQKIIDCGVNLYEKERSNE